jgi:hypothetical protein
MLSAFVKEMMVGRIVFDFSLFIGMASRAVLLLIRLESGV